MIEKLERIVELRKANSLPAYMRFCHQDIGIVGWSEYNSKGVLDRWLSILEQRLTKRAPDSWDSAQFQSLSTPEADTPAGHLSTPPTSG